MTSRLARHFWAALFATGEGLAGKSVEENNVSTWMAGLPKDICDGPSARSDRETANREARRKNGALRSPDREVDDTTAVTGLAGGQAVEDQVPTVLEAAPGERNRQERLVGAGESAQPFRRVGNAEYGRYKEQRTLSRW